MLRPRGVRSRMNPSGPGTSQATPSTPASVFDLDLTLYPCTSKPAERSLSHCSRGRTAKQADLLMVEALGLMTRYGPCLKQQLPLSLPTWHFHELYSPA